VLAYSEHANTSPQIRREVERAVHKGIAIVPLRIADVPLSKSLEYFISTPHWLDALSLPSSSTSTTSSATLTRSRSFWALPQCCLERKRPHSPAT
jgi:hypothetical protein